jgi:predicted metalloendopeptidase
VPWQPAAVKGLARLVDGQPLSTWQDYLRVRTVERFADVLPRSLSAEPLPGERRSQRALEATQQAMQDDFGQLYVARHFPADRKARVHAIAGHVVTALARRMETAPWLSPTARATAQAKLKALYFGIGYPDRWPDDAALAIAADDPAGNLQRVARRDRERALARIGQAVDRRHWAIAPQWPGAVLTFNENSYNFAAALLQAPKFDPEASEAANYGAIGAIVGHEASHFVDTLGADYEADGRRHRWWSAADLVRYAAVTDPLERQFSAYRPFDGVAVDGRRGLVENFADLVGLTAAFDAHRLALGAQAHDAEFVRQRDREFFIGFARSWRIRYRDDALRTQALSDHAPEVYRVWTVRNLDAWYQTFDVQPGHRLYLPPAGRVKPWGEAASPPP